MGAQPVYMNSQKKPRYNSCRGDWLSKTDLKKAYLSFPIPPPLNIPLEESVCWHTGMVFNVHIAPRVFI